MKHKKSTKILTKNGIKKKKKKTLIDLDHVGQYISENTPDLLNLQDEDLSVALLGGMKRKNLNDIVCWFLRKEGIDSDEKYSWGPPKWNYTKGNYFDSFDYYALSGCPNCGSTYSLDHCYALHVNPPMLVCFECGHRACQLHFRGESELIIERLRQPCHTALNSSSIHSTDDSATYLTDSAVYIRGFREQYNFGSKGKEWWQSRFLPTLKHSDVLDRTQNLGAMLSSLKAPTIKEVCEMCSNTTAYYTTFQARSADEGMTIMYECTKCHHRKTFNN